MNIMISSFFAHKVQCLHRRKRH